MKLLLGSKRRTIEMDVSLAIVNIVLLLVFFFIATGQLLNAPSFGMDLAETEDLPLDRLPTPILIVHEDGSWSLDGQPVARELLGAAVQALPRPTVLHLLIDGGAPASWMVDVVSQPELADVEVRLVTLHVQPAQ